MSIGLGLATYSLFGFNLSLVSALHFAAYFLADLYTFNLINGERMSVTFLQYCMAWLWQELVAVPVFVYTLAMDKGYVVWRDKLCKLNNCGDIEEIVPLRGKEGFIREMSLQNSHAQEVSLENVTVGK